MTTDLALWLGLGAYTFAVLFASLGSLSTEGKNEALPMLWIICGIAWVAAITASITLTATGINA
jgi:hypothetical protein